MSSLLSWNFYEANGEYGVGECSPEATVLLSVKFTYLLSCFFL